jgi:hypothetical protein
MDVRDMDRPRMEQIVENYQRGQHLKEQRNSEESLWFRCVMKQTSRGNVK